MQLRVTRWSYALQIRTAIRACRYSWPSGFPFNSRGHYNLSLFNLSIAPHNTTSTPTTTHREGMSSGAPMEFGEHRVETHARETDLSVVYTIDPAVVDDYINSVEQLLARDKYKVVGIDLQYTAGRPGIDQKVAVAQLCVRHHVLIYHYCMATEPCDRFNRFVNSTDYKFAMVETTDDVKALSVTGLACKNLVEIRDHYRVWGSTKKDSLVELASAIIDPYYEKMKQDA